MLNRVVIALNRVVHRDSQKVTLIDHFRAQKPPLRHSEMQEMPVVEAFGCLEVCLQNKRAGVNKAMRVRVVPSGINYVIVRLSCVHQLHIVFNYHILLATPFPSLCPAGILSSAGHFTSMILILIYLIFFSLRYPQQFCRGSFSFKCSIIEKK